MSLLRERHLAQLMMDYVRQHQLHLYVTDLSTWEEFKRFTGVLESSASLVALYRESCTQPSDYANPDGNGGELQEHVHFTWCNDAREGLQSLGMAVRRDVAMVRNLLNCPDFGSDVSDASSFVSEVSRPEEVDSRPGSPRPRSKKRQIDHHQRFMQIKRNLDRLQKRRRSSVRRSLDYS